MSLITFRRVSHVSFAAWLVLSGAGAGPLAQPKPSVIVKVVDRGNKDAGIPTVDVRVLIGGKVVDKGVTDSAGEFSSSVPQIGQVVTIEYEKLTYVKAPERKQIAVRQRPQQVSGALIRANEVSSYYARLGDRIEQLAVVRPPGERDQFKTEEFARVRALSYANRQLVAASLTADLQAELSGTSVRDAERAYRDAAGKAAGDAAGSAATKPDRSAARPVRDNDRDSRGGKAARE